MGSYSPTTGSRTGVTEISADGERKQRVSPNFNFTQRDEPPIYPSLNNKRITRQERHHCHTIVLYQAAKTDHIPIDTEKCFSHCSTRPDCKIDKWPVVRIVEHRYQRVTKSRSFHHDLHRPRDESEHLDILLKVNNRKEYLINRKNVSSKSVLSSFI